MEIITTELRDVAIVTPQRIAELVDLFISSKDINANSKRLYKRTLNLYFN